MYFVLSLLKFLDTKTLLLLRSNINFNSVDISTEHSIVNHILNYPRLLPCDTAFSRGLLYLIGAVARPGLAASLTGRKHQN